MQNQTSIVNGHNNSNSSLNHQPQISRQVIRQAERENVKAERAVTAAAAPTAPAKDKPSQPQPAQAFRTGASRWAPWVFTPDSKPNNKKLSPLLPYLRSTIPPGAPISPNSSIKEGGKVVGHKNADGTWGGDLDWTKLRADEEYARRAALADASIGIQTVNCTMLDIDVNHPQFAAAFQQICFDTLGVTDVRGRAGSARRALFYMYAAGEEPVNKVRLFFIDPFEKAETKTVHLLEVSGRNNLMVLDGMHKSGVPYEWTPRRPCDHLGDIPRITVSQINRLVVAFHEYFGLHGLEVVPGGHGKGGMGGTGAMRKKLPCPELAGDIEILREILKAVPCDENTMKEGRENEVLMIAAFKAAAGEHAEGFRSELRDWWLEYPGADAERFESMWTSIREASYGMPLIESWAQAHGYDGAAQRAFADELKPEDLPPEYTKQNPLERMVANTVYVSDQNLYYDKEDGQLRSVQAFRAHHTPVTPYGSVGQNTADAQFQNYPQARKVATLTVRPGAPALTEIEKDGIRQSAVNLWRPSSVKPDLSATAADCAPWLDLVNLQFGADTRQHFLSFWAYVLQNPGKKVGHMMGIVGGQGTGKDTVLRPLFEAVGVHNLAAIDTATLATPFNPYLKAQVIYAQELITYGRRDLYNSLKQYLSSQATSLTVNEKHMRPYTVPNTQIWVFTSNHDNALSLEDDDRRVWVHKVLIEEAPSADYFDKLHAWLDVGGTAKVFGWLLKFDVSGFNPMAKPPITTAKRAMLEASKPDQVRWLCEQLSEDGPLGWRHILTINELRTLGAGWDAPFHAITDKHATDALKAAKFQPGERVRLGQNDFARLWARGLWQQAAPEAMRSQYLKEAKGVAAA